MKFSLASRRQRRPGVENGEGYPLPSRLRGLGERPKPPSGVWAKRIWCIHTGWSLRTFGWTLPTQIIECLGYITVKTAWYYLYSSGSRGLPAREWRDGRTDLPYLIQRLYCFTKRPPRCTKWTDQSYNPGAAHKGLKVDVPRPNSFRRLCRRVQAARLLYQ